MVIIVTILQIVKNLVCKNWISASTHTTWTTHYTIFLPKNIFAWKCCCQTGALCLKHSGEERVSTVNWSTPGSELGLGGRGGCWTHLVIALTKPRTAWDKIPFFSEQFGRTFSSPNKSLFLWPLKFSRTRVFASTATEAEVFLATGQLLQETSRTCVGPLKTFLNVFLIQWVGRQPRDDTRLTFKTRPKNPETQISCYTNWIIPPQFKYL